MSVRGWLVAGVVTLQVSVPLVALLAPPPTRLGFQMYSAEGELEVTVRDSAGKDLEVPWNEVLPGQLRPELDWTHRLPARLCELPEAAHVTVEQQDQSYSGTC